MDEAARIALNVDGAKFGARILPIPAKGRQYFDSRSYGLPPTFIENGNVKRKSNRLEELPFAKRTFWTTPASYATRNNVELGSITKGNLKMIVVEEIGEIPRLSAMWI